MNEKNKYIVLINEIENNIKIIEKLDKELSIIIESLRNNIQAVENRDKYAIGYLLHNIYNAFEDLFLKIAKVFENTIEEVGWHKSLLNRMALDITPLRPKVITHQSYSVLLDMFSFRHIFRHAYDYELDFKKMKNVYENWNENKDKIFKDIKIFIKYIQKLIKKVVEKFKKSTILK